MDVNLKSLIGKLNQSTRRALEGAAGLCVSRTHYDVEVEHYLLKLLEAPGGDFDLIAQRFGVDRSRLETELGESLDVLKTGNARTPAFSPGLAKTLAEAWKIGSLDYGLGEIRSGATILALVSDPELGPRTREISRELQKIDARVLQAEFLSLLGSSGKTPPNLDQFTVNLTENAKAGKIDPVLGRDFEIRQMIDILMRRRQNNPILTGEAGVGKTAVVEGFALRVAHGDVPPALKNVHLRTSIWRCCRPARASRASSRIG
jgi:type VI secretion system protein VasG